MDLRRILVVDDDKAVRDLVSIGLESECIVDEAFDGQSALDAIAAHQPDLILLDVSLPDRSGLDLLIDLRRELETPVVMLTASADEGTEWRSRDLGAVAFVAKPVDADDLRRLVVRHLP